MGNADALSCMPVDCAPPMYEHSVLLIDAHQLPITAKNVARYTLRDPILSKLTQSIITPGTGILTEEERKPFKHVWEELSVVKGCVMKGARVVVPRGLRAEVLKELHSDHQGIVRTKAIARSYVWWPGIDGDIENFVRSCLGCAQAQHMPRAVGLHPWEMPSGPWQRLHLDFAGPFLGKTFLILVDAYSKWPEVVPMAGTNAQSTIDVLMSVFAVHGLPHRVVSDNGPPFISHEFRGFCSANDIHHVFSAPYHPATNGEAERFVQTFKDNMKCRGATPVDVHRCIFRFLSAYRSTPHQVTGMSPSSLLLGRRVRNRMDLMRPDLEREQKTKGWRQLEGQGQIRSFVVGDSVMVRTYRGANKWEQGEVRGKFGNLHYNVLVNGNLVRKHVDQLGALPTRRYSDSGCNSSLPVGGDWEEEEVDEERPLSSDEEVSNNPVPCVPIENPVPDTVPDTVPAGRRTLPPRSTRGILPARYKD